PSSSERSSILRPLTPPEALTTWKYAIAPARISVPSSKAGPEKAADWPIRIVLDVTPGSAAAQNAAAAATVPASHLHAILIAASLAVVSTPTAGRRTQQ